MSLKARIEEAVQKMKDFQNDTDDCKYSTGNILVNISDFIDDELDGLVEDLEELADEVGEVENKVEKLEEEVQKLEAEIESE
ncbi:hypothetical protein [Paenibacillus graminis]|uniref:hypothetical protein n=1 Tax=Paenibacillus graminis TaxID=189425 RepID=UPI002DBC877B|nr:hypothetical protein [Paenibacillus graminis]MEC0169867.1 hypothetical protein [Paenibacillus graminis]